MYFQEYNTIYFIKIGLDLMAIKIPHVVNGSLAQENNVRRIYELICPLKSTYKPVDILYKENTIFFEKISPDMRPREIPQHLKS